MASGRAFVKPTATVTATGTIAEAIAAAAL
jgi:hypothetical protein